MELTLIEINPPSKCRSFECLPPDGHSSLQLMDTMTGGSTFVTVAADCLVVQVGEAAQICQVGSWWPEPIVLQQWLQMSVGRQWQCSCSLHGRGL
jgi:hypothetical protein